MSDTLLGCTDGYCHVRFPRDMKIGMHTNGGCKCLMELPLEKRLNAERAIQMRDREISRLKTELGLYVRGSHE